MANSISGPSATNGVGQTAKAETPTKRGLQFAQHDKGSSVAQLLRGQISQNRLASGPVHSGDIKFLPLTAPSAATVSLLSRLT